MADVTVIGGGLAGCEAAWQLAEAGFSVQLLEMKPVQYTPAHHYEGLAELVCSNSLKADRINSAAGLLKAEMTRLGSLLMQCARKSQWLPAVRWQWIGNSFLTSPPMPSGITPTSPWRPPWSIVSRILR